ncbi:ER membrane protein complex subunit 1 isoform X2 [Papilio machaon]|uniref:ER membrane protein complex subunit 1 isoform X2 n=1 Tax=Papilio machaon TaxID=76193 RepID=UPI001E6632A8|nr:ER membrane protein complex subunit 1 isoform X2 [Papilio machaon]
MNWYIVFFSLINLSMCIYEDQIGKFDWRQTYVGRIKFSQFDTVSTARKLIVATEENVLAALHLKTGEVVWRHVFESASTGNIQLLHVSDKVVTVTGSNPYLVRGWDSTTGILLWEWSLTLQDDDHADFSEWWVHQGLLVHMLPVFNSHIEVTMYNLLTGQNRGATSKLPAAWVNDGCVLSPPYYSCISGNMGAQRLLSVDVTSSTVQLISQPLFDYLSLDVFEGNLKPLDGNSVLPAFIIDDKKIVIVKDNNFEALNINIEDMSASVTIIDGSNGPIVLQAWTDDNLGFKLSAYSVNNGKEVPEIKCSDNALRIPEPELGAVLCSKTGNDHACRIVVNGADDAIHLMQQGGRVLWSREESLANVVGVEFVDLPVSETDAAIESEFDQKEGSIWAAFSRRLHSQYQQLHTLLASLQSDRDVVHSSTDDLVRDYFNLHKVIVLVTEVGKIIGIDNLSGEILWQRFESALDTEAVAIFTRRTARHPPYDAYLTIVGKHEESGNGLIISLNPITGELVGERVLQVDGRVLQCALLHQPDEEKLHGLVLLYDDESVQVFPVSSERLVDDMYLYVAETETAKVQGYALKYNGRTAIAQKIWSLDLGSGGHRIVVSAARAAQRTHSPGRALADRSVLYKYNNPNLVLFITEGPDPVHKDVVRAVAVDGASGAVAAGAVHRRARATHLAVHADNCLAYLYLSDKHRRVEIATMELYEGKERWGSPGAAFSSFSSARAPAAARQAYIVPTAARAPRAAALTVTERSLTDRHLLLALSNGAIVEIPWAFLDPRRAPVGVGQAGVGEEGVPPYAPELPLPAEAVLNYNRTLHRVRALHTHPAGIESTSLVLATGLDLYYTRVAPSKTFDLLKDDFDYHLISIVLVALVVASYSTKYFASRKMLKMAWK